MHRKGGGREVFKVRERGKEGDRWNEWARVVELHWGEM